MKIRFAWALCFLTACGSSVIQDPAQDPNSMTDAGPSDGNTEMPMDASTDAGNVVVGQACTTDAECGGGKYHCQTTAPGGYCSFFCTADSECPTGSVCSPVPYSRVSGMCMNTCTITSDCRADYSCAVVYLFPGQTTSPSSSSPVCWEAQDAGP